MQATAKEAKEFLLGKSVLNKFTQWALNNKHDVLILKKSQPVFLHKSEIAEELQPLLNNKGYLPRYRYS